VRGKTQPQEAPEGVTYHLREWRFGEFSRSVQFPTAIDEEQIKAQLADGVLTIHLPKSARAVPRRITVNAS
jgi:HSP20 family protein